MTVAEYIEVLKIMPQHLPVCVADWNEEYREPSEGAAERIGVEKGEYDDGGEECAKGQFVQIG